MAVRTRLSVGIAAAFLFAVFGLAITMPGSDDGADASDFSHKGDVRSGQPPGPDISESDIERKDVPIEIYKGDEHIITTSHADWAERHEEIKKKHGLGEYSAEYREKYGPPDSNRE